VSKTEVEGAKQEVLAIWQQLAAEEILPKMKLNMHRKPHG